MPSGWHCGRGRASAGRGGPQLFAQHEVLHERAPNTYEDITSYNNFYEFGTDKSDPKTNAATLQPRPWSVAVTGEAEVTGNFTLEDILKPHALEERIYRFRCVEAWSMVMPWVGFPLGDLLKRFKPTSKAKYVEFTTLMDPKQMPGQRYPVLEWPYVEGLRMDEAMHPLTLMVAGVYGQTLPNQNGAPLRLIVPWKYGFKSVKSIVKIRFTEKQPRTAWKVATPNEYGFYANVNPPWITRAGARPRSGASARASSRSARRRCPSTAMPTRSRASTRAWTCGATSDGPIASRRRQALLKATVERRTALPLRLQAAGVRRLPAAAVVWLLMGGLRCARPEPRAPTPSSCTLHTIGKTALNFLLLTLW